MGSQSNPSEGQILDSVHNALRILQSFSEEEPVHGVTELSRKLGLHKSTVSRIIATLSVEGFVMKDGDSRAYRLGPSALSLGNAFQFSHEVYNEARPILRQLVDSVGETAQLAVLDEMDVFFVDSIESNHPLRFMASIGSRSPIYCSSVGRVMIAFRDDDLVEEVIQQGFSPWTSRTITDEKKFREEIKKIRKQGFAISLEEKYEGVIAIAAPVLDRERKAIAAVNVVGPSYRLKQGNMNRCIRQLVQAASEISKSFSY